MCDQVAYTFLSGVGLPAISNEKNYLILKRPHTSSHVNESIELYVTLNVNIPLIYRGWTNEN